MSTWWIDEPRLLGCSNPAKDDLEQLRRDGFTLLVCLLDESEQTPECDPLEANQLGFERHNIPVRDFQPPTTEQLSEFVRLVDRDPSARAVIHCAGGVGRTGTFAAAYWIARGMGAGDAIAHVRRARPGAVETREQRMALEAFETICR